MPLGYPETATPHFEVAAVRVNKSGDLPEHGDSSLASGRFNFLNTRMRDLIMWAYMVPTEYIRGPHWLDTDRFDVIAKAPPNTKLNDARLMLRTLLAERFRLAIRQQEKVVPAFALTAASNGVHLKPSAGDTQPRCLPAPSAKGLIHIECTNLSLKDLASYLPDLAPGYVDRPVVDLTGKTGTYDFSLAWIPQQLPRDTNATVAPPVVADLSSGPTIFDVLEKQYGLKLQPQKRPMPTIVVLSVDRVPRDN